MRPTKAIKSSSQNVDQKLVILNRAKRGDPLARKKLREMGLLYWEHNGRVIVRRLWERSTEGISPIWLTFSRYSRYLG
jgi:hypothetical protein